MGIGLTSSGLALSALWVGLGAGHSGALFVRFGILIVLVGGVLSAPVALAALQQRRSRRIQGGRPDSVGVARNRVQERAASVTTWGPGKAPPNAQGRRGP